jgi:long-subunit fatty acid transport protein
MRASHRSLFFALATSAIVPATAHAGGLYVPGVGPVAQQRAGANVAAVDDPSAVAQNPAGLAETEGTVILVGSNFLDYSLAFTRRGTYDQINNADYPWEGQAYARQTNEGKPPIGIGNFQALPMLAAAFDLSKQVPGLHLGVGIIVPNSFPTRKFGADWQINVDDGADASASNPPPPTRYDAVEQEAAIVEPSVAVGYKINDKFSVGGRFTWGFATVKASTFTWGDANYAEDTQHDSAFSVDSKDNFAPAFGLGVKVHPTDAIDVGLSWDSQLNVHAKGTGNAIAADGLAIGGNPIVLEPPPDDEARCAPGGVEGALKACVDLALPMVATVGGRYKLLDASGAVTGDVELDVAWEHWSAASDYGVLVDGVVLGSIPINKSTIRHNFQDVISTRLGGSYRLPVGDGLTLRGGLAYDTAAAPKNWERVDIDGAARTTVALGAGYPFGKFAVMAGVGYVYEGTRDVGTDCNPTAAAGMQGCDGSGQDQPQDGRVGPDPIQPLNAGTPFESPFNAGKYESSYVLMSLGVIAKF